MIKKHGFTVLITLAAVVLLFSQFKLAQSNKALRERLAAADSTARTPAPLAAGTTASAAQGTTASTAAGTPAAGAASGFAGINMFPLSLQLPDTVFTSRPKLIVLRLAWSDCHDCRDSIFAEASRLVKNVGKENFCILVANYSDRDFQMYKRLYQYEFGTFLNYPQKISSVDNSGKSYFFVANKACPQKAALGFIPEDSNYHADGYFDRLSFLFK